MPSKANVPLRTWKVALGYALRLTREYLHNIYAIKMRGHGCGTSAVTTISAVLGQEPGGGWVALAASFMRLCVVLYPADLFPADAAWRG